MHGHGKLHLQTSNQSPVSIHFGIFSLVVVEAATVVVETVDAVVVAVAVVDVSHNRNSSLVSKIRGVNSHN